MKKTAIKTNGLLYKSIHFLIHMLLGCANQMLFDGKLLFLPYLLGFSKFFRCINHNLFPLIIFDASEARQ